jgi:hypothetical protein
MSLQALAFRGIPVTELRLRLAGALHFPFPIELRILPLDGFHVLPRYLRTRCPLSRYLRV